MQNNAPKATQLPPEPLEPGLYLLKRQSETKVVEHYGVLDIGNRLSRTSAWPPEPVVVHQTPPQVTITPFHETGTWQLLAKVEDEAGARERIREAVKKPEYDLFGHNCEHFARFVALGKRESTQLQVVGIVLGIAALVYFTRKSGA
jgi:hypothetical protein